MYAYLHYAYFYHVQLPVCLVCNVYLIMIYMYNY